MVVTILPVEQSLTNIYLPKLLWAFMAMNQVVPADRLIVEANGAVFDYLLKLMDNRKQMFVFNVAGARSFNSVDFWSIGELTIHRDLLQAAIDCCAHGITTIKIIT